MHLVHVQGGIILRQWFLHQLSQCAGELNTCRPTTHNDEGEQLLAKLRIGFHGSRLKAIQDVVAQPHSVFDAF